MVVRGALGRSKDVPSGKKSQEKQNRKEDSKEDFDGLATISDFGAGFENGTFVQAAGS